MKIYVASSWRNTHQPGVVNDLISAGHEVYDFRNPPDGSVGFAWSNIDTNWQNWSTKEYNEALKHPLAVAGFNNDFNGMKWADCCVMVLPCGRSANTEAGWMSGTGKPVYVITPVEQEPELMYKIYDGLFDNTQDLISVLAKPKIRTGLQLIGLERQEQIYKHGHTLSKDISNNGDNQLLSAIMMLASGIGFSRAGIEIPESAIEDLQPEGWDRNLCLKMLAKDDIGQLKTIGALAAAEIDRVLENIAKSF